MSTDLTSGISRECIECDREGCNNSNPGKRCSRCKLVYYCGKECQKVHWKTHKKYCVSVEQMRRSSTGSDEGDIQVPTDVSDAANSTCGICLSESIQHPVVLDECKHVFCFGCLHAWQRRSSSQKGHFCPYCRSEISAVEDRVYERADRFAARAKYASEEEKQDLCDQSLEEIEKVLDADKDDIHALVLKSCALFISGRHEDTVNVVDRLLELHAEAEQNGAATDKLIEQYRTARLNGNEDEAERTLARCREIKDSGMSIEGLGTERVFDMRLQKAQAQVNLCDWDEALSTYVGILSAMGDELTATGGQQYAAFKGACRCFYETGVYDKAIKAGNTAIMIGRHNPGVHKYVALAHQATGDIETARNCMNQAVLHEAPWDEDNIRDALALYNQLKEETSG